MNICVIGGAGYIGSHVCRAFLDKGYQVTVYDNLSSGCRENLFQEAAFVEGDILDTPRLEKTLHGGYDGLVHLAALKAAGESMVAPEKYATNNLCGTIAVCNAAVKAGVTRFVFSSSAAVYGEPKTIPMTEEHPVNPENFYGFTKLEIERLLGWYDSLKHIRFAALRYFNAAGYDPDGRIRGLERNPANLLPVCMEVAAGTRPVLQLFGNDYPTRDGTCIRDYVHVTDLADAHVRAFDYLCRTDSSLTVNLGSETGITVQEMIDAVRRITGTPVPVQSVGRRPGDPAELIASSGHARATLKWKPCCSDVDSLVSSTWNVYRDITMDT